jgi:hypothetical protein
LFAIIALGVDYKSIACIFRNLEKEKRMLDASVLKELLSGG